MKLYSILKTNIRLYSNTHTKVKNMNNLKTFEEIPTLPQIPAIGHLHLFWSGGKYKLERLTEAVQDISKKLGPIFKLKLGGNFIVITTNADNTETLCRNDGKYPIRPPFPALLHYRKKIYGSVGVVPGNGEEWYKYRQGVLPLLKTNVIQSYRNRQENVANKFVDYISKNRNDNLVIEDIYYHLLKYTIQAISIISPGFEFDCLTKNASSTEEIIQASQDFMDGIYITLMGPLIWKYFKTGGYRKLETSHLTIHRIIEKHLKELDALNSSIIMNNHPYLYILLKNKSFSWNDKLMLAMEIFLGGIDATATVIAATLHYFMHNNRVQELARKDCITEGTQLSYLKACIKESMRMNTTAGAHSRFIVADTNIGGYLIPKNTLVSAFTSASAVKEEYFEEPNVYKPERWLRNSENTVHPFASLPFGFGARMCPGRRIAEQEIVLLLQQVLKSYELEPDEGESEKLGMVFRMNRIPDRPINIKFVNTNS